MAYAYVTQVSDGTLASITLTFPFLDKDHLIVTFDGAVKTLGTDYNVTGETVSFSQVVPNGVTVRIQRDTPKSDLIIYFGAGSLFNNDNLDTNSKQLLFSIQEAIDGGIIKDIFNDLNMHDYRIYNVGDAVDANDAVSKKVTDALDVRIKAEEQRTIASSDALFYSQTIAADSNSIDIPIETDRFSLYINGALIDPTKLTSTNTSTSTTIHYSDGFKTNEQVIVFAGNYPPVLGVNYLDRNKNLSDIVDRVAARTNLHVYGKTETDTKLDTKLNKSSNLSDLSDSATARSNLSVYSKTEADTKLTAKLDLTGGTLSGDLILNGNLALHGTGDLTIPAKLKTVGGASLNPDGNLEASLWTYGTGKDLKNYIDGQFVKFDANGNIETKGGAVFKGDGNIQASMYTSGSSNTIKEYIDAKASTYPIASNTVAGITKLKVTIVDQDTDVSQAATPKYVADYVNTHGGGGVNIITQTITGGDTTHAPSADAVFKQISQAVTANDWQHTPSSMAVNDFVTSHVSSAIVQTVTAGDTTHATSGKAVADYALPKTGGDITGDLTYTGKLVSKSASGLVVNGQDGANHTLGLVLDPLNNTNGDTITLFRTNADGIANLEISHNNRAQIANYRFAPTGELYVVRGSTTVSFNGSNGNISGGVWGTDLKNYIDSKPRGLSVTQLFSGVSNLPYNLVIPPTPNIDFVMLNVLVHVEKDFSPSLSLDSCVLVGITLSKNFSRYHTLEITQKATVLITYNKDNRTLTVSLASGEIDASNVRGVDLIY